MRESQLGILVVDDEPELRDLLRATFEGAHHVVDEAASAVEAEARIQVRRPAVIVLDLRLPGMTGAELTARLKSDERTKTIPIVLLTGPDVEETRRAQRAGADALLRKPFSPLELRAVAEQLVGRGDSKLTREATRSRHMDKELLLSERDLRHLLEIERGQRELLQQSYLDTVTLLANTVEIKDTWPQHTSRVQRYAVELLRAIEPTRLEEDPSIVYGFLLHDVGKIGIPDAILRKAGPLTSEERRTIQRHTVLGEQILGGVAGLQGEGLRIVRSHHERWDGRGYPDGLQGRMIPLGARVFAVADALDAMTTDRPYRTALRWERARDEIVAQAGRQFDPHVVEAFQRIEVELRRLAEPPEETATKLLAQGA